MKMNAQRSTPIRAGLQCPVKIGQGGLRGGKCQNATECLPIHGFLPTAASGRDIPTV